MTISSSVALSHKGSEWLFVTISSSILHFLKKYLKDSVINAIFQEWEGRGNLRCCLVHIECIFIFNFLFFCTYFLLLKFCTYFLFLTHFMFGTNFLVFFFFFFFFLFSTFQVKNQHKLWVFFFFFNITKVLLYSFSVKKKKTRRCIHFRENEKHTNFAYFSFLIYTYKKKIHRYNRCASINFRVYSRELKIKRKKELY